ncbi:glucose 1-dehydrogenase [Actinomadura macra]|uniref:glucose 1-dehydrogenase n=1 Tax=Actinomadura macra TaxID=46164 RepID=UPI000836C51A|nr:glucose 1-dehydrogenase [Actinomadura macra]
MKALTVIPGRADQVRIEDRADPVPGPGELLVEGRLLGICGTDYDIVEGHGYGWAPPGRERLVIGHESLGRVLTAPPGSGFEEGDLVVGIVRRPDPVPCTPCAHDEADFCRNGRYTERGIKELDGFGAQRWVTETRYAVKLDPALGDHGVLLEPASVLAKAWEQTDHFATRTSWRPKVVLVTGAGPIGLFAALLAVQRGLEVHVVDIEDSPPKRALVNDLGATFHTGDARDIGVAPDVVIECTGHGPLVFGLAELVAPDAVICLTGISPDASEVPLCADRVNRDLVLENIVMFGTVNAGRRNFEQAADVLAKADPGWLDRLITRRVPLEGFTDGLHKDEDDIKVVVDLWA